MPPLTERQQKLFVRLAYYALPIVFIACLASPGMYIRGGRWFAATPTQNPISEYHHLFVHYFPLAGLVWLTAVGASLIICLYALPNKIFGLGFAYFLAWLAGVVSFTAPLSLPVREREEVAFLTISSNAAPLLVALEKYKADAGVYPTQLGQLVPAYLSEIPRPGILGADCFDYRYPCGDTNPQLSQYELRVFFGLEDWLFYRPGDQSELRARGGIFEPKQNGWFFLDT